MEEFWILILVAFFATNSLDKAESVKLEETPLQTFDEIFGEGWRDKGEAEDFKTPPTKFGQNVHHQIDRQNTQIGQIEPNSSDQNAPLTESDHSGQIEPNSTDQLGQIEPNSTDQNAPLTESDHSDNAKNGEKLIAKDDERKRKIVAEFHAMRNEFKQKGKFSTKERTQIEKKISKHLKVSRSKIYEWKKEFGLSGKMFNGKEEHKHLVEKFDQKKAELKRAGCKNSQNELDKTVAKELGLSFTTIYNWKRKLGQIPPKHKHPHSEQKELMKRYYEIKDKNPKFSDKDIAKMLKIGSRTLRRWKKKFERQQLHPNSVDGHSVEENAGANVQEIYKSNWGSI